MSSARMERRTGVVALAVVGSLSGACSACRGSAGHGTAGFLHVLRNQVVTSYRIDAANGELGDSTSVSIPDAQTLAVDPAGRLVYVAYSSATFPGEAPPGAVKAGVRSYTLDETNGRLAFVAEQASPIYTRFSSRSGTCGWEWLAAGPSSVFGIWRYDTYHDTYYHVVAHGTDADGHLGTGTRPLGSMGPEEGFSGTAAADPAAGLLYPVRREGLYDGPTASAGRWGLFADAVGADSLTPTGSAFACGSLDLWYPAPAALVAGGGLVAASVNGSHDQPTTCSFHSPELAPLAAYAWPAKTRIEATAAFLAASATQNGRLAVPLTRDGDSKIALLAVSPAGEMELRTELRTSTPMELLFDPSGRFLYATARDTLRVYSIDGADRLAPVQALALSLPTDDPFVRVTKGAMGVTMPARPPGSLAKR